MGSLANVIFKLGTDAAHTEELGPVMMLISGSRSTVCHLGLFSTCWSAGESVRVCGPQTQPGCQQGGVDSDINCARSFVMPHKLCYKNFHLSSMIADCPANLDTLQLDERRSLGFEHLHVRFPLPGKLCPALISSHLPVSFFLLPLGGHWLQQAPVLGPPGFSPNPSPDQ